LAERIHYTTLFDNQKISKNLQSEKKLKAVQFFLYLAYVGWCDAGSQCSMSGRSANSASMTKLNSLFGYD